MIACKQWHPEPDPDPANIAPTIRIRYPVAKYGPSHPLIMGKLEVLEYRNKVNLNW